MGGNVIVRGPITVSLVDLSAGEILSNLLSKWIVLTAQDLGILSWVDIYYMEAGGW